MGLLDFLSPALTVGTEAAGAQQQAQLQSALMKRQQEIQALLMQRQFQNQDIENALKQAQTTRTLGQNDPNTVRTLAGAQAAGATEGATPGLVSREQQMGPIKATNAGLAAEAENPAMVERAQGVAEATLPTELTKVRARAQASTDEFLNRERAGPQAAKLFMSQPANVQLVNGVNAYAQVKTAIQEARQGNPAALKSALISFASVADPKAQLRQGVMHEVTQVDPSVAGRFDLAVDRLASGKLPPRILDDMEKMVDAVHRTNAAMYEQRRQAFLSRQPMAEEWVPTTEEQFNVPGVMPSGNAGTGTDQFGPFGKYVPKQ